MLAPGVGIIHGKLRACIRDCIAPAFADCARATCRWASWHSFWAWKQAIAQPLDGRAIADELGFFG